VALVRGTSGMKKSFLPCSLKLTVQRHDTLAANIPLPSWKKPMNMPSISSLTKNKCKLLKRIGLPTLKNQHLAKIV